MHYVTKGDDREMVSLFAYSIATKMLGEADHVHGVRTPYRSAATAFGQLLRSSAPPDAWRYDHLSLSSIESFALKPSGAAAYCIASRKLDTAVAAR
jgi:hypothetical protein